MTHSQVDESLVLCHKSLFKMMIRILIAVILVYNCQGSSSNAEKIHKQEGEDVILFCDAKSHSEITAFHCKVNDSSESILFSYKRGKLHPEPQMVQYISHTELNYEDLQRGLMNITIKNVKPGFSGNYTCFIPGSAETPCYYTLEVEAKKQKAGEKRDDPTTSITPQKNSTTASRPGVTKFFWMPVAAAASLFGVNVMILCFSIKNKKSSGRMKKAEDHEMKLLRGSPEEEAKSSTVNAAVVSADSPEKSGNPGQADASQ